MLVAGLVGAAEGGGEVVIAADWARDRESEGDRRGRSGVERRERETALLHVPPAKLGGERGERREEREKHWEERMREGGEERGRRGEREERREGGEERERRGGGGNAERRGGGEGAESGGWSVSER